MVRTWLACFADLVVLSTAAGPSRAADIPAGSAQQRLELGGKRFEIFTYRPKCTDPALLVVLHGQNHNADDYRDWARPIADWLCLIVAAPRFGEKRFPRWRYQHGGIARDGAVQDRGEAAPEALRALEP